jgi:hypothetical protein
MRSNGYSMLKEIGSRSDIVEECYEFMLAYAAQGLPSERGSTSGSQIRDYLQRARTALTGLPEACTLAIKNSCLEPASEYTAFFAVVERDVGDSLAAIDLVLAQPTISSQLIDNLNASVHLRCLLTDLFLLGEVLKKQDQPADQPVSSKGQ